jgi:8-oxo-dGTP diphosphatase
MNNSKGMIDKFNLRVYGICLLDESVLLVHENLNGFAFTKFPGGGLEFGEGLKEALVREIKEELDLDCNILEHFYTTDFFQQSAFKANEQLISVYFLIDILEINSVYSFPLQLDQGENHQLRFFWQRISEMDESMLTFPIDKLILERLKRLE